MKRLILSLALLTTAGCSGLAGVFSPIKEINSVLDASIPADFKGNFHVDHTNSIFDVTIDAGNLRKGTVGWTFDWLIYQRHGYSHGAIRLGNVPPEVMFPLLGVKAP
jgi:hypothetical protein